MSADQEVQIPGEPRPRGYCWCDCGQPTKPGKKTERLKNRYLGIPGRYRRGHGHPTDLSNYAVKPSGCWEWQGPADEHGYACVQRHGRRTLVHRIVWEHIHAASLPSSLHIDHLCYMRSCVNPDHLEVTSPRVNHERRRAKRLTRDQVEQIRKSSLSGRDLAFFLGFSETAISHARTGRTHTYEGEAERVAEAARLNALPRVHELPPPAAALEEALHGSARRVA